ncbi:MAG: N-formylglutamate amidohydrolase [Myxococcota bacterium]
MTSHDAVELIDGNYRSRVVLTCEHAGSTLPAPWSWPKADLRLVGTHWSCDLGADALTRNLAEALGAPAVLSRFTRLLVDPNRPLDSDTLFRSEADGLPVELNASVETAERERRIRGYYEPYHATATTMVQRSDAEIVFGIHTFTPIYEGDARSIELGVLFDQEEDLGNALVTHLQDAGFVAAANEPYSGKAGLAYSPVLHAEQFNRRALEIEARQDLVVEPDFAARLVVALQGFFS